jgi:hypothetical protein
LITLIVTFQHSAAHTTTWVPEDDYFIVAVQQTNSVVVSSDPSDGVANFTTPTANRLTENIIFGSNSTGIRGGLEIPVFKGRSYFASTTAAGSFTFYLARQSLS